MLRADMPDGDVEAVAKDKGKQRKLPPVRTVRH
jgi:hypothetical protein